MEGNCIVGIEKHETGKKYRKKLDKPYKKKSVIDKIKEMGFRGE